MTMDRLPPNYLEDKSCFLSSAFIRLAILKLLPDKNKSAGRLLSGVRISGGTGRKVIFPSGGDHRL